MNWEFIGKYLPMYEKAALLTVKIGVIGILFAILLGLVCAAIQYYKVPVLRWIVAVYVELSRNTPLLVQLFFIYYGFPKIGIRMSAEVCGVVGLAFLGGIRHRLRPVGHRRDGRSGAWSADQYSEASVRKQ